MGEIPSNISPELLGRDLHGTTWCFADASKTVLAHLFGFSTNGFRASQYPADLSHGVQMSESREIFAGGGFWQVDGGIRHP